jgi:hypothetical protein
MLRSDRPCLISIDRHKLTQPFFLGHNRSRYETAAARRQPVEQPPQKARDREPAHQLKAGAGARGGAKARSSERKPAIDNGDRWGGGALAHFSPLQNIPIGELFAPAAGACSSESQRACRA